MTEPSQGLCADDVIITDELDRRPSRAPDHEAESQALSGLAETIAINPDDVLQRLVEEAMKLTRSESAGVSLMEPGGEHGAFRWVATAGAWAPYRNSTMPREMSPCGEVIARDQVLLVSEPARVWSALLQAEPAIGEALLAPFRVNGELTGTVWVIKHGAADRFEREDARLLQSLSRFAAAAHQRVTAITKHRESEERQAFLLELSDALRPLADPAQIKAAAARLLGEQLQVNRSFYADAQGSWWHVAKGYETAIEPLPDAPFAMSDYGDWIIEGFRADRPLVVEDMAADPRFSATERAANLKLSIAAVVALPLVKNGKLVAMLTVQNARPRPWSPAELALVGDAAERTWAAVERARSETALQASEAKYRTLFETMGQGYVLAETVRDADGQAIDMRLLEVNPAYERLMGIPAEQARGRGAYEIIAGVDRWWLDTCDRIARAGQPERVEQQYNADGGWFEAWVYPRGRDRYEVLFEEITERKRAEAMFRKSEERQAFLLRLSDAMRAEPDAGAIALLALRALAGELQLDRCYIAEYRLDEDRGDIPYQVGNDRVPPFPASVRLSDFPEAFDIAIDRTLIIDDVNEAEFLSDNDKRNMRALGIRALVTRAARKGENVPLFCIVAVSAVPRHWTSGDIALIEEVNERTWAAFERARAEEALRDSEERFRDALEIETVGATFWKPGEYTLARTNDAFLRMIGRTREEAIGISSEELTAPEFREESKARVAEAERTGILAPYEKQVLRPDGSRVWLLCAGRMLKDELFEFILDVDERKRTEAALRESEMRFREFGENSSDALWIVDARTKQLEYLSPAFESIWGESRQAVMGDVGRWAELVHPDDRDLAGQAMPRLLAGEPFVAEYRIVRSDGQVRWIRDAGFPIKVDGVIKRGGGIAQDVTDLRQSQAALRESEERLREFGEASQDVLWIRDAETLRWTYLTPAFETIYGFGREEALAGDNFRNWLDLIVPEDRHRAVACIQRVREGERVTFEYRIRRPNDGAICWLRNTDFPIRDISGRVAHIAGIGHDVTALKHAEMALAAAELRQRTLVEGIPNLVWRAVDGGKWTWASPQWTDYTGQSDADSHGWGWLEMVHVDDQPAAREAWDRATASGGFEVEYRLCHAGEGRYRWFKTRATPVRDGEGQIVEWLGTSTDINDLRELQARQGVLVAELQHRTRNLITVVRAVSQQTLHEAASLDDFGDRFGDRLSALSRIQGLLSHLSAGQRVSFEELLGSELTALGVPSDKVTLDGPADVLLRSATVQTFSLALHELATNALKYGALSAPGGHLTVRWQAMVAGDGQPRLQVDWRETGVDMTRVGDRPQGGGYGRELIERALPYQLQAETTYELTQDGVHCTIDVPVSAQTA